MRERGEGETKERKQRMKEISSYRRRKWKKWKKWMEPGKEEMELSLDQSEMRSIVWP